MTKEGIILPFQSSVKTDAQVYELDFSSQENEEYISGTFQFPILGFSHFWHPASEYDYALPTAWSEPIVTKVNDSMPIFTFFDESNRNRRTLVFSDSIHKIETVVGVHEETATITCSFQMKREDLGEQGLQLYVLDEPLSFSQAVIKARNWLYVKEGIQSFSVPDAAKKNVYSTWYSYHQLISSEQLAYEAKKFSEYNLQTVIVDDGWQTDDASRRYSYAGDWEISKKKFPEMKKSIEALQKDKLNYLLWISLPYVGMKSKHWAEFKEKFLYIDTFQKAGILDPRFPEVREYLVNKTVQLVRELNLNGVKIDFLDVFKEVEEKTPVDGWDIDRLEGAIQQFLIELSEGLKKQNSEILIEFREDYFGPFMNQVGNIFRVKDCPNNYTRNRMGIAKLRLLCPAAAIHSDMIMWHPKEDTAFAAKQVLNCLFSIPQVSMKLHELAPEHQEMLKFWLTYIQLNQEVLLGSSFEACYPQNQFSQIWSKNEKKTIVGIYQMNQVIAFDEVLTPESDLVNASDAELVFLRVEKKRRMEAVIRDCRGKVVEHKMYEFEPGVTEIRIPVSGLIQLKEKRT